MPDPIHLAFATDDNFAMQTATAIGTVARSHVSEDRIVVHLIHDGLEPDLLRRIAKGLPPAVEVECLDGAALSLDGTHMPHFLPRVFLFRLKLPDLLPDLDRVIYLDGDIVVRSSLRSLWETDLGAGAVAGVRDMGFPYVANVLPWRELGLPPSGPYYNSGVLLIALDVWRASDVGNRAVQLTKQYDFSLGDQCALNAVLFDSWKAVPPKWNLQRNHLLKDRPWVVESAAQLSEAIDAPAIVHFCGPRWNRPWRSECDHPFRDEWFKALDTTDWSTWRPPRRAYRRVLEQKVKRAVHALLDDPDPSPWR